MTFLGVGLMVKQVEVLVAFVLFLWKVVLVVAFRFNLL